MHLARFGAKNQVSGQAEGQETFSQASEPKPTGVVHHGLDTARSVHYANREPNLISKSRSGSTARLPHRGDGPAQGSLEDV